MVLCCVLCCLVCLLMFFAFCPFCCLSCLVLFHVVLCCAVVVLVSVSVLILVLVLDKDKTEKRQRQDKTMTKMPQRLDSIINTEMADIVSSNIQIRRFVVSCYLSLSLSFFIFIFCLLSCLRIYLYPWYSKRAAQTKK